jgi:hypothetical protein
MCAMHNSPICYIILAFFYYKKKKQKLHRKLPPKQVYPNWTVWLKIVTTKNYLQLPTTHVVTSLGLSPHGPSSQSAKPFLPA